MLRAAGIYFVIVFGAGFLLGILRVLFIVPATGDRAAELLELPIMVAIVAVVARLIVRRYAAAIRRTSQWLQVGGIALACMIAAEVGVGVVLRGMSVWDALFARDPLSGIAYYLALTFLALAPWLVARWGLRTQR